MYLNDDPAVRRFIVSSGIPMTTLRVSLARQLQLGGPLMRLGEGVEVSLDRLLIRTEPYGMEPPCSDWSVLLQDFPFLYGFDGMLGMDWLAQYARVSMILD